jgi:prepilin-type N-terminal cleavage/methylation domain-containing protein
MIKFFVKIKNNKGFTLIELLVVVAIISLLSSIVLAGIQEGREKAEHRKFEQELINIKTAVQLYRTDNKGEYPDSLANDADGSIALNDLLSDIAFDYYNSSNLNLPPGVNSSGIYTGTYAAIEWGCGKPYTEDVNYFIWFNISNYDGNLKLLYRDGSEYNPPGNIYCIEI